MKGFNPNTRNEVLEMARGYSRNFKEELQKASIMKVDGTKDIVKKVQIEWGLGKRDAQDVRTVTEKAFDNDGVLLDTRLEYCGNMGNLAILLRNFSVAELGKLSDTEQYKWGMSQKVIKENFRKWRVWLDNQGGDTTDTTPGKLRKIDPETDFTDKTRWEIDWKQVKDIDRISALFPEYATDRDIIVYGPSQWDNRSIMVMFDNKGAHVTVYNLANIQETYSLYVSDRNKVEPNELDLDIELELDLDIE